MLKLSKHFIENWKKRVDDDPDPVRVNKIISRAVRFQKGEKIVKRQWNSYSKTLTSYVDFDLKVLITVDHFTNTIVSVFSEANMPSDRTVTNV